MDEGTILVGKAAGNNQTFIVLPTSVDLLIDAAVFVAHLLANKCRLTG
jgi:hypothetical protein